MKNDTPIARRVRAWFAPVARESGTPAVFDPSRHDPTAMPSPWINLGDIANFRRTPATQHKLIRAGAKSAAVAQVRQNLETRVELDFRDWGKLQMALAGGSQHMNVLASDVNADPLPSGGSPQIAVALLPSSTAQELVLGAGAVDAFRSAISSPSMSITSSRPDSWAAGSRERMCPTRSMCFMTDITCGA